MVLLSYNLAYAVPFLVVPALVTNAIKYFCTSTPLF